jgi:hypothetical protein
MPDGGLLHELDAPARDPSTRPLAGASGSSAYQSAGARADPLTRPSADLSPRGEVEEPSRSPSGRRCPKGG